MLRRWSAIVAGTMTGAVMAFYLGSIILFPLGQQLLDSDYDDMVLWAIRYFQFGVIAISLLDAQPVLWQEMQWCEIRRRANKEDRPERH